MDEDLRQFVEELPKVELHVHLEAAMQPGTLLALARRRGVDLPGRTESEIKEWFRFRDFDHFVEVYLLCSKCLWAPEDFQLLAEDLVAAQARQNVLYTEAHFTISTHMANGVNASEVAAALAETVAKAEQEEGIRLRLIPDIVRNMPVNRADQTLEWALENSGDLVVALGLSGKEDHPCEPFRGHFEEAAAQGLRRVAHAGEQSGPEAIWAALELCGAERIGHGISAVESETLLSELRNKQIPLEVCPTSNLRLGYATSLASHPVGELYRGGVELSINSDDPMLFDTTLTDEYSRVAEVLGLGAEEMAELSLTALRHSFLPVTERERFERVFEDWIGGVGEQRLGWEAISSEEQ
jgi:adenosine deaminase